jgi:adenosine kinase
MFKRVIVSGSLAFDRIMDFPGKFSDHILPDKIHILNVCFAINGLRENFGGTAGNIAYALSLLGERPHVVATAGRDFDPYRTWMIAHHLPLEHVTELTDELTAGAYITTDRSDNQITAFNPGAMKHRAQFDPETAVARETIAIVAPGNLEDMEHLARARGAVHLRPRPVVAGLERRAVARDDSRLADLHQQRLRVGVDAAEDRSHR